MVLLNFEQQGLLISVIAPYLILLGLWRWSWMKMDDQFSFMKRVVCVSIMETSAGGLLFLSLITIPARSAVPALTVIMGAIYLLSGSKSISPSKEFLVQSLNFCLYWMFFCLIENVLIPFAAHLSTAVQMIAAVSALVLTISCRSIFYGSGNGFSRRTQFLIGMLSWGIWMLSIQISARYLTVPDLSEKTVFDFFILILYFALYYGTDLSVELEWLRNRERTFEQELLLLLMEESQAEQENTSLIHEAIHDLIIYRNHMESLESTAEKTLLESALNKLQKAQYPILSDFSLLQRLIVHFSRKNPDLPIGLQIDCDHYSRHTEMILCHIVQTILCDSDAVLPDDQRAEIRILQSGNEIVVRLHGFDLTARQIQILHRVLPRNSLIQKTSFQKALIRFPAASA